MKFFAQFLPHAFDGGILRVGGKGAFFGFGSTSIRSTIVTGQTEGLKGWLRRDGWFAKVDNRFGYEKWLQGGSIGL